MLRLSTRRPRGSPPRAGSPAPVQRVYYGWVLVAALSLTETVSFGILSYAFPVFLAPMESELGWTRTQATGAFSLAALVSGACAIPVGRWVDRHGARALMTLGSLSAVLLLLAWSRVQGLGAFYLIWIGLGVAKAAVLYEPAFAVIASWFERLRGRALTALTFAAGFASVLFIPLADRLVREHGWREALVWLALLLAVLTVPPHALLLRRRPADLGLHPDGRARSAPAGVAAASTPAAQAVRSRTFRWLTLAFGLSALVTTALLVHLIPYLVERGFEAGFAARAMALVGLLALPGRLVFTPLGSYWPRPVVTASIFGLHALALGALLTIPGEAGVWAFVALFGAGFGAITPARAALLAEFFGSASFGSINGVLALVLAGSRALAPVSASLLYDRTGGYRSVLLALLACSALAALAVLMAELSARRLPPLAEGSR